MPDFAKLHPRAFAHIHQRIIAQHVNKNLDSLFRSNMRQALNRPEPRLLVFVVRPCHERLVNLPCLYIAIAQHSEFPLIPSAILLVLPGCFQQMRDRLICFVQIIYDQIDFNRRRSHPQIVRVKRRSFEVLPTLGPRQFSVPALKVLRDEVRRSLVVIDRLLKQKFRLLLWRLGLQPLQIMFGQFPAIGQDSLPGTDIPSPDDEAAGFCS